MLRPPTSADLTGLLAAAESNDRDLDLALLRLGVLAPADLDEIRRTLRQPHVSVAAGRNPDGHRIIEISHGDHRAALLHHDGRVQHLLVAAA